MVVSSFAIREEFNWGVFPDPPSLHSSVTTWLSLCSLSLGSCAGLDFGFLPRPDIFSSPLFGFCSTAAIADVGHFELEHHADLIRNVLAISRNRLDESLLFQIFVELGHRHDVAVRHEQGAAVSEISIMCDEIVDDVHLSPRDIDPWKNNRAERRASVQ
mmetsp:Transcript_50976/g.153256  ORF Transcript_50976/g.153256 Transcript_50976/m.153256 type:complete len:159 (+) Transcript_50976:278-754(+)